MSSKLSRRLFVGSTLATSSIAFGEVSWISWLATDAAEAKIFGYLKKHFELKDDQRGLARDFIVRLRTPGMHTEDPQAFQAMVRGKDGDTELERYVVEEFMVASNYFAILHGQDTQYRMLDA